MKSQRKECEYMYRTEDMRVTKCCYSALSSLVEGRSVVACLEEYQYQFSFAHTLGKSICYTLFQVGREKIMS